MNAPFLIYLVVLLAYLAAAFSFARLVWKLTPAAATPTWQRVLLRTSVIAILFSPTFVACGAGILLPYPLLVAYELYYGDGGCGQITSYIAYNAVYVVIPAWVLGIGIYGGRLWWIQRHAL